MNSSLRRWLDIVFLSAVATAITVAAHPLLVGLASSVAALMHAWPTGVRLLISLVLATALISPLIRLGALRGGHFRTPRVLLAYPPCWFAAVISWASHLLIAGCFRPYVDEAFGLRAGLLSLPLLAFCAGLALLVRRVLQVERRIPKDDADRDGGPDIGEVAADSALLIEWLSDEAPITRPSQDRFKHSRIARRLARIAQEDKFHTVALQGPFGSGKSSILNMMGFYLAEHRERTNGQDRKDGPEVWVCRVGAGG